MEGINKSESGKVSYGNESDISIKKYEEKASKLAGSYNTFIENLLGNGIISKEDVITIDAEMEKDLREGDGWKYDIYNQDVEDNINSNLTLSEKKDRVFGGIKKEKNDIGPKDYEVKTTSNLSGEIGGQNIKIERNKFEYPWRSNIENKFKFSGTLDGKQLSQEESKEIFSKYYEFQKKRLDKIENLIEKRKDDKNREKRVIEYQKIKENFEKEFNG